MGLAYGAKLALEVYRKQGDIQLSVYITGNAPSRHEIFKASLGEVTDLHHIAIRSIYIASVANNTIIFSHILALSQCQPINSGNSQVGLRRKLSISGCHSSMLHLRCLCHSIDARDRPDLARTDQSSIASLAALILFVSAKSSIYL